MKHPKHVLAYESKRNNNSRFKQSYIEYVNFLAPKIWEIPEVRLSPTLRKEMIQREVINLNRDIREVLNKITFLNTRLSELQERSRTDKARPDELSEIPKINNAIKRQKEWEKDLQGFKIELVNYLPNFTL